MITYASPDDFALPKEPRGITGNEYLCNKESKKSLHFFLSKERIKTVPSKHSHPLHQLLPTFRTAIKPTPAVIPHNIGSPRPSSHITGKHVPHRKKAFSTPQESPYCDTEKALPQPNKHHLAAQIRTTPDCQHLTKTAQNPRIRVRNVFTTKISYSRGVADG